MKNSAISLFAALYLDEIKMVAKYLQERKYVDGEVIFQEGDPSKYLAIIEEGKVSVEKSGVEIAVIPIGRSFGEMALLENRARSATCKSVGNTTVTLLSEDKLKLMMRDDGVIAAKILLALSSILAARLRNTTNKLGLMAEWANKH